MTADDQQRAKDSGTSLRGKKKSERHHWWPECVSRHWADEKGAVHWVLPDGSVRVGQPRNFGVITNGHYIKLGNQPGQETVWDQNFEPFFSRADSQFPGVIAWLQSLDRRPMPHVKTLSERFLALSANDAEIAPLVESLLSLAARIPLNRESAVGVAELLRGPLPERERNSIIAVSICDTLNRAIVECGTRGKIVVLFSPEREYIFGDGFCSNLRSPVQYGYSPKILAPITPEISVLYFRPSHYQEEPRLMSLVVTPEETRALNEVVQIYAQEALFYRSQAPDLMDAYRRGTHLHFSDSDNTIDKLIASVPGVIQTRAWPFI